MRLKGCAGAIAGSLCVCMAQAMVDFVWYVPACMAMMTLLAACALRARQLSIALPEAACCARLPRWAALAAATVLLPIGAWMISNRIGPALAEPYWNQYLLARIAATSQPRTTDDGDPATHRSGESAAIETEQERIDCLKKTLYWNPDHARAQLALAEVHLRLFDEVQANAENRMTLASIRDAALDSRFTSRESLHRWLDRAVGDHWRHLQAALRHCRRSLSLCPLQGQGYLYLARLGFLEGKEGPSKQSCVDQALRIRPFDGGVAYAAAAEALLAGDASRWLELLQRSFRCGRRYQRQLIRDLVGRTPPEQTPEMIDFIVRRFQPDLKGLELLYHACRERCPPQQLVPLCRHLAQQAKSEARTGDGPSAADLWLLAYRLYTQLGDDPQALACARRALQCDTNNYHAHYQLALCLLKQKQFAEARSHLHWCLQRAPDDKNLENKIKEALRGRLDAERCSTAFKNEMLRQKHRHANPQY